MLDEYYIPRTERAIMETYLEEIVEALGSSILLIEYGSGNSTKTRILLEHLSDVVAYIPVDIAREQLLCAAQELASDYSPLEVIPVCADYTNDFKLPVLTRPVYRKVVYFPGSTIGNFEHDATVDFLKHIGDVCGTGGGLLIGVDLKKEPKVLHQAYNDLQGITAAFNLNLLERLNRELDFDFQLENFEHYAFYNPQKGRIELHLISLREQAVCTDGIAIPFARGESIWTENSYKFTLNEFQQIAVEAGFTVERVWMDERQWFSVQYLIYEGN